MMSLLELLVSLHQEDLGHLASAKYIVNYYERPLYYYQMCNLQLTTVVACRLTTLAASVKHQIRFS